MKLTTTAGALRHALSTASHIVPAKPTMSAYSGVLLMVKSGQLSVVGSDGDTTISALLKVSSAEDGQALLPPRPLLGYLGALRPDEEVQLGIRGEIDLEVSTPGASPYLFRLLSVTFPQPPSPKGVPTEVDLSHLAEALAAVRSSTDRSVPLVQLVSGESGLTLSTTDNYRISRVVLKEAGFGEFSGVLHLSVVDRVARSEITHVGVDAKGRTIRFFGADVSITSRLRSEPFPMVESLLSQLPDSGASFHVDDLRAALAKLESIAVGKALSCKLDQDLLEISVDHEELGSGAEKVYLDAMVDVPFEFFVKPEYLRDAVASHKADKVRLSWTTAVQPLFISSNDPLPVTNAVAPVRNS